MTRVRPQAGNGTCSRLEDDKELHIKASYSSDNLTDGVKAATQCTKGYKLNLFPEKLLTAAYCRCDDNDICKWKFSKGDIMCVKCQTRILQGKEGRAITLLNEWANGILIVWRIMPYAVSENGWSVGIQLPVPLESTDYQINSGALELTGVSNKRQYFTFTPKKSSPLWNVTTQPRKMYISIQFNNVTAQDKESIKKMANYYYKFPSGDQSCAVDRFDCYPVKL